MVSRRSFVAASGAALAATTLPHRARAWIPGEPRDRIDRVGVQLYTVRAEMKKDVAATLERVSQVGYKEVEFAGYYNLEPARVRALLDQNGLTAPSVHVAVELLEKDFAAWAATARTIGHETLIVPSLNTRQLTNAAGWKGIAARFNALGAKAHDAGLTFAFHNHAEEPRAIADGSIPMQVLLGETDPRLVHFQMDLYWMIKAGGDPLAYFAKYPGRFISVHVKDATPAPELAMRDVGAGAIDWKRIFAQHAKAGIRHYYVEHDDPTPDPFMSIEASYKYLAALTW